MWNIQLRGKGVVYHEAGQVTHLYEDWNVIAEIKRVGLTEFDNQALCEYFSVLNTEVIKAATAEGNLNNHLYLPAVVR